MPLITKVSKGDILILQKFVTVIIEVECQSSKRKGVRNLKLLNTIAMFLVIVGGLNWGLVGAFDFNLVQAILGEGGIANIVYILVGLSAILVAVNSMKGNGSANM